MKITRIVILNTDIEVETEKDKGKLRAELMKRFANFQGNGMNHTSVLFNFDSEPYKPPKPAKVLKNVKIEK